MKCWIIDDDPIARILIKRKLSKVYPKESLLEFSGAEDAVAELLEGDSPSLPNLILLDLNMPVMSGWDFLDSQKELLSGRGVDVAILTSSIDESDQKKAGEYPCVAGFLNKPLNLSELEEHLKERTKVKDE